MDETESSEGRYRAPALDKGLDILEILANQPGPLTRTEIVRELGLSPSQIYRMLERLVARGYVSRVEGGDRFALSMKLFLLGTGFPPIRRLTAQAQPLMDEFSAQHRQSCHLVIPESASGVVVAQASPASHWEFRARVGARMGLFNTGSGITLLAFQNPTRMTETLGQWGVADGEALIKPLKDELKSVRKQGYRIAPSRQVAGVTDVSVPVYGPAGDAFCVVTCAHLGHPEEEQSHEPTVILEGLRYVAKCLAQDANGGVNGHGAEQATA